MIRRPKKTRQIIPDVEVKKRCRECRFHFDHYSVGADGEHILCRCPHYFNGDRYKFLSDFACEKFKDGKEEKL